MYTILYDAEVINSDIPKLSKANRLRVQRAIEEKLHVSPEIFGLPLRRSLKGRWKLRVGDYRIIFIVEKSTVFISAILHRSVVYVQAEKRQ